MGNFNEHLLQSQKNLEFLSKISTQLEDCWDWQVTVSFYSALHLINAHVVEKTGSNYLTHGRIDQIINPFATGSLARLDEEVYTSYNKLLHLSRRSRYLLNEKSKTEKSNPIQPVCATFSKHLEKAIIHLNVIIKFINRNYSQSFNKYRIKCIDLKGMKFEHFIID